MNTFKKAQIIQLPKIQDPRGNLTFIEGNRHIPFTINRVYWIYDVPGGQTRGGHAHYKLEEFIISLSGSFDVVIDNNGSERKTYSLNRSYFGLYVPNMIWRHLENFSTNSVCLILSSLRYSEEDYIRDYEVFRNQLILNGKNDNS
jgi:hypothetical protein